MEYLYLIIAVVAFFTVKSIYDQRNKEKLLRYFIEQEWGCIGDKTYTAEKFAALEKFYKRNKDSETDIDDITWNDLDMDRIYALLNSTNCTIGEEYLYHLLHKPVYDQEKLTKRNQLIEFFQSNKEARIKLQVALRSLGTFHEFSVYDYFTRDEESGLDVLKHIICPIGLLTGIVTIFIQPAIGIVLSIFFLIYNIVTYYKDKPIIQQYLNTFSYILRMMHTIDEIKDVKNKELSEYITILSDNNKRLNGFKKGSGLVVGGRSFSGGLDDIILDYMRMMFHIDILKFNQMHKQMKKLIKELQECYQVIGYLDSMIAIASYRAFVKDYALPTLYSKKEPFLKVSNIYHPLVDEPVKNSFYETRSTLITGSNASGKSTFLKTVAINSIFAQTIYTTLSDSYESSYFKILSSMALQDSIMNHESYYIVEIKSLKRILDKVNKEVPILCFVDEVLRGTNTLERIAASAEILYKLGCSNVLCLAATHDIELTHILEKYYSNYHFQEEVVENDILFDYTLYKGRAVSKNAIKLLKIIGYNDRLIDAATNRANQFLETNQWEVFH